MFSQENVFDNKANRTGKSFSKSMSRKSITAGSGFGHVSADVV